MNKQNENDDFDNKKENVGSVNSNLTNNSVVVAENQTDDKFEYERLSYSIPKRLDSLKYSRFHSFIIISLGISWVLDGYEVSLLSVLSGVIQTSFKVNEKEIGLAGSVYLLGCVIGSLFFGFLASLYGRKTLFNITLIIYAISIISTSLSINIYMFFACRFFTGIAVGGEYSSIFSAIDELIPPSIRGRADLIIDGTWHFGSLLAALISYITLNYNTNKDIESFLMRVLFSLGAISIFPVIYMRKFIPESPRWLLYKGKYKEALKVLESIEYKCNKEENKNNCLENISNENNIEENKVFNENSSLLNISNSLKKNQLKDKEMKKYSFGDVIFFLFKIHRTRFFYSLILMASQAFFYNGIFYTYTLILQKFYNIEKNKVGLYLIPLSLASFIGPIFLGKYFDTWSRRKMIALTFISSGLFLIITALNFLFIYFGFVIQQILWFVTFLIASPAASSAHLTVSEIFPIEMRSQAMAIFFSMGLGIGGVVSPLLNGWLISNDDKNLIFLSYLFAALIMIFAGIFGFFFGVDSENKSLESIANFEKELERNKEKIEDNNY